MHRMSARQSLKHSWFKGSRTESAADIVANRVEASLSGAVDSLSNSVPISRGNSLSEAELYSALNKEEEEEAPPIPRNMPRTVAWWQERAVRFFTLVCSYFLQAAVHAARHTMLYAETTKV